MVDGTAKYTHALGLELDVCEKGMGIGLKRFALLVEDHKAKLANVKALSESLASPGLRTSSWLFESLCDMFL